MIDDLDDWQPPPVCDPCQDGRHVECEPVPWCECHFGQCPPIPLQLPAPREGS